MKFLPALAFIFCSAAASAADYGIKGIELDRSYSDQDIIAQLGHDLGIGRTDKFGNSVVCMVLCSGESTIGTSTWHVTVFKNKDGTVGNLTGHFDAHDFAQISAMFHQKFGAPTKVSRQTMHNAFGAAYNNVLETWESKQGDMIQLINYIDAESGSLSLQSAKNISEETAYKKAHASDGKI